MSVDNVSVGVLPKSPFTKAVKNIRSLIDKGQVKVQDPKGKVKKLKSKAKEQLAVKDRKHEIYGKPKEKTSGSVVYLSHLPHGFEEKGIRSYLEQFGKVSGVRLVRSQKTGRSRGFAFVEFVERDVAEIVVQTMNNYLMFKRLVKAELLKPPHDGENALRVIDSAPVKPENTRTARCRKSYLLKRDKHQNRADEIRVDAGARRSLRKLQRQLAARGIAFHMRASKNQWELLHGVEPPVKTPAADDREAAATQDASDS